MTRRVLLILTISLFFSGAAHAYIRDYSNTASLWKAESNKAYVSGKTIFEDNTSIINLFIISFEKNYECNPTFKISFLEGNEYGELLETRPIDTGFLKLYVDNKLIYDGPIVELTHSNATEFGASVSSAMLDHLYAGHIVTIELVGKMDIRFNLKNAKAHINKAQKSCLQEQSP